VEGCFLGPFSTIDLTTVHDCVIGTYAYVQVGELAHHLVEPGRIWVRSGERFDFKYQFPQAILDRYILCRPGKPIRGRFIDFINSKKQDFQKVFEVHPRPSIPVPSGAVLNHYAVVKGETRLHENVLVAQRAYLENAWLGPGANAQENCYILNSRLEGFNVTAHGGKVFHARLGKKVFVGFNACLSGSSDKPLAIGDGSIIMPHTIIDLEEPVTIPSGQLVWGFIRNRQDLKEHSLSLEAFSRIRGEFQQGALQFKGLGEEFVQAFVRRIEHILDANGAYFDGKKNRGHAQKNQDISFNTIQPYTRGALKGLYPTIEIRP
jgi:carbonic anhydrase/acetyltransferase-like protein (isoleucine patch superfamily)